MPVPDEMIFLFDVDNTLLDNDRLISDLIARSGVFAIVPRVGVEGDVPLAQRWRSTQRPPSQ